MSGGGDGVEKTQEERELYAMQTRVAEQGIQGRDEANAGYRDFARRGRELGSIPNQNAEADRFREDAYATFGNAQRMQDANMASMGVNPGDPRFHRGRDTTGVAMAGQTAAGMNDARRTVRSEGLKLEGAGYTGLAGNDPTGALNSMGQMANAQANRAQSAANAEAQGWGALGQGAMYGLANYDKIAEGASALFMADGGYVRSYADGGEVMGVQRFANGGNVYDRAMEQVGGMAQFSPQTRQQPQQGIDAGDAVRLARKMVDKTAGDVGMGGNTPGFSTQAAPMADPYGLSGANPYGLGGTGVDLAGTNAAVGANPYALGAGAELAGAEAGAALGAETGAALGAEAALGAGVAEGAAAGAGAAGAAGAGAAGGAAAALGTAVPVVGAALALGSAFGLFRDGGEVPAKIGNAPKRKGRAQGKDGGKVKGKGGPKDDQVPAWLSPGEFVLPVGSVRKYGLDQLEKMRQEGLAFEKQQRIS